jgi:hypothetical protein
MIVTLISEPRTGSNTLMNWFKRQKSFDVLLLPSYKESFDYQQGLTPKDYKYENEHLFIKEEFHCKTINFDELISVSKYVIFLYREDFNQQLESWVNAIKTGKFNSHWIYEKDKTVISEDEIKNFEMLKKDFKERYLDDNSNFKISYEDLYFNNGIDRIVTFLKGFELEIGDFPSSKRYRINPSNRSLI